MAAPAVVIPFPDRGSRASRHPAGSALRAPGRPVGGAARRRPVRLTRRGRLLLVLALLAVTAGMMLAAGSAVAGASGRAVGPATEVVVAQPGETLWSIASALYPQEDPRAMVARIRDLNGLGDAVIRPGQAVLVPAQPQ